MPAASPAFSLRRLAIPVFGPSLLFGLAEGAALPVVALAALNMSATAAEASLLVALVGIASLLANLPASLLAERLGERTAIQAAALLATAAFCLAAAAEGLALLAVAMSALGAAGSVFNLARQSYLTVAAPFHLRARALSTLGGSMRVGAFLGPLLAALVMSGGLEHRAFLVAAGATFCAFLIALTLPEAEAAPARAPGKTGPGIPTAAPTFRRLAGEHRRVLATVGTGVLLVSALRAARQVVIPLWCAHRGMDPSAVALAYGLSAALDMVLFYPAGRALDLMGRRPVALAATLLMGVAFAVLPLTSPGWSILAVAGLLGIGNGLSSGLVMTLGADYSPEANRQRFLGLWRMVADTGTGAGPVMVSAATALAGIPAACLLMGAAGTGAALVFRRTLKRRTDDRA